MVYSVASADHNPSRVLQEQTAYWFQPSPLEPIVELVRRPLPVVPTRACRRTEQANLLCIDLALQVASAHYTR